MTKIRWLSLILVLFLLLSSATTVFAQTYLFSVDRQDVTFTINENGTATIEYFFDFTNDPIAAPFDLVTLGLPSNNYSLSNITADVNGQAVTDISRSEYVSTGIDIALGSQTFTAGQSARVHVLIREVTDILYNAKTEGVTDYASFQFSPSWFGREFVSGLTDYSMTLILPPGLTTEEPRYFTPQAWPGSAEPESSMDDQGRVFYTWHSTQANAYTQYTFGGAFPNRLVPASAIVSEPLFNINFSDICCFGFWAGLIGVFGLWIYQAIWGNKKRKLAYLPPKILVEGNGIKRGLTAIEAGVVMQEPMDRIVTMILFSVIRKGAASVKTKDPMTLDFTDPKPANLMSYEEDFLTAFKETAAAPRRKALQDMMVKLVKSVTDKMKGFSHKETVAYYKDIMERAWTQVESAQTPEVKMENYDKYMDWTMLDDKFERKTEDVFRTSGPVFVPMWWSHYDPTFRPASGFGGSAGVSTSGGGGGGGGFSVSMPNLPGAAFAASITGGVQNFAAKVVGDVTSFTNPITEVTNPMPKVTTSSSRGGGGGGHSCACACACAGCACACAGGGR
ncbi:MAG: hypothetical protein AB9891_20610 [Anaerolineaceae bacterium]